MDRPIWISAVVMVAATALAVVGAMFLLNDGSVAREPEAVDKQERIEARPDCPAGGVGGFDLPCLGGEVTEQERKDVTVAVVWAYWCPPCRDELEMIDEFAAANPQWEVLGVHSDPNAAAGAALLNEMGVEMASFQDSHGTFAGHLGLPPVVPVTVVFKGGAQVGMLTDIFTSPEALQQAVAEVV